MSKRKYEIGMIVEGRWEIVGISPRDEKMHSRKFILENIYNHTRVEICDRTMKKIIDGTTSIYITIRKNIAREKKYERKTNQFYNFR